MIHRNNASDPMVPYITPEQQEVLHTHRTIRYVEENYGDLWAEQLFKTARPASSDAQRLIQGLLADCGV